MISASANVPSLETRERFVCRAGRAIPEPWNADKNARLLQHDHW
jgi:hypothetical protein